MMGFRSNDSIGSKNAYRVPLNRVWNVAVTAARRQKWASALTLRNVAHRDAGGGAVHSIKRRHSSNLVDLVVNGVAANPALGALTSL